MTDLVTHEITIYAQGFTDSIPISLTEFEDIREAKRQLMFGVGLEEKIDLVLENYAELGRDLLNMALEHSIFAGKINVLIDGGMHLANRRVANFLTTARLYRDQIKRNSAGLYGRKSEPYKKIVEAIAKEETSCQGWRVMDALRDYVQHRGLPTHRISFPTNRDDSSDPPRISFGVALAFSVTTLADDSKLKGTAILGELQAVADKEEFVNLLPFVRDYVESFGRIHQTVRDITALDLDKADELIDNYRAKASEKFGKHSLAAPLVVIVSDAGGVYKDREYLTNHPTNRRKDLAKKNRDLESISRHYVSSNLREPRL